MISTAINILTAPAKAFRDIREKPSFLFPLLLVIITGALAQVVILQLIDFEYFIEAMIDQALQAPNARPESEIRQGLAMMTPNILIISALAASLILPPLIYAGFGLYLWLLGKLGSEDLSFKPFFAIVCWSSLPNLLATLAAMTMVLLSSTRQFAQDELNPLSFGNLLFAGNPDIPATLSSQSLTSIWALGLLVLGYRTLTESSWTKSAVIVLLPPALILGGIAALTS